MEDVLVAIHKTEMVQIHTILVLGHNRTSFYHFQRNNNYLAQHVQQIVFVSTFALKLIDNGSQRNNTTVCQRPKTLG